MTADTRGKFIVIEGIDGTGKSTLARALDVALRERGIETVLTREPTDGPFGKKIRELARTGRDGITPRDETELFIADRREHVAKVITPALDSGKWVVQDRYFYSTIAYQGARGVDIRWIQETHREFAPEPDLLVLLKLPVAEALERVSRSRGDQPDHFEKADALAAVSLIFDHLEHPALLALDAHLPTSEMVTHVLAALDSLTDESAAS